MTVHDFLNHTLQLGCAYTILNLLYVGFTATVGSLMRFPMREVSLFFGPRITGFSIGGLQYSIRAIPLGSFVRFGTPDDDELPPEEQTLARVHPLHRIPAHLAGPTGLVLCGMLLTGPSAALRSLWSALGYFASFFYLPHRFAEFPRILHERFASLPTLEFLGLAAVYMAAANLIPIPINPGGAVLIDLAKACITVPLKLHERLLQIGFIILVLITTALIVQYVQFGFGATRGGA